MNDLSLHFTAEIVMILAALILTFSVYTYIFSFVLLEVILAASPLASRGFAPRGFIKLIFRVLDFKENLKNFFLGGGGIFHFWGGLRVSHPPRK